MRTGELTLPLPSCGAWERGLHILQEFWVSQPNVSVAKLALPLISHVLVWMWERKPPPLLSFTTFSRQEET